MCDKSSFIFHESFYTSLNGLDNMTQLKLLKATIEYGINGIEPELSGLELSVFNFIKTNIDSDKEKKLLDRQKMSEGGKKHKGNQYTRAKENKNEDKMKEVDIENSKETEVYVLKEDKKIEDIKEDNELVVDEKKTKKNENKKIKVEEDKKEYGDHVRLTDREYKVLVYHFGATEFIKDNKNRVLKLAVHSQVVDDMIDRINDYLDNHGRKKYKNFFQTALNWFRNTKINKHYEYAKWMNDDEKIKHFKTDSTGAIAYRYYKEFIGNKQQDVQYLFSLSNKFGGDMLKNFDFVNESDDGGWKVIMYEDGWLVQDKKW